MKRSLIKSLWMLIFLIFLCGCTQTFSIDYSEKEILGAKKDTIENLLRDGGQVESVSLASMDWFVYDGEFYVRVGKDIYEKGDFPKEVQCILQKRENPYFFLKKEDNRLVLESKTEFSIYDFTTNCMERHKIEHEHLRWQIYQDKLYYIMASDDEYNRLMVYDMALGNVNEIDTGEYIPLQFYVRRDGAIGMWGENAKGEKEYCFLEGNSPIYISDKDEYWGWTYLYSFTEKGIILEREYSSSSLQGTKIYGITKDGEINILASLSNGDNLKAISEGSLVFAEDMVIIIDLSYGYAKAYDYEFSYIKELQWNIDISEGMKFVGYYVQEDNIWGIWQLEKKNLFMLGALIQNDSILET